ncbi:MAG: hydrolase [Peptococcaceae bacterium]|nr:hydrolase [Peptococcaceae bacterium]
MDKFVLKRDETVLLIIDIQERLASAMKFREQVISKSNALIGTAAYLGIPIMVTEQYPKGLGKTVPEISSNIPDALTFEKTTFSGCTEEVAGVLKQLGKRKIIVTGMETHVCVLQTVRDLLAGGYQVFVVGDAVCSRTKENYLNGITLMSQMGAVMINTETVFFDLIKKANTTEFRELLPLIK